MYIIHKTAGGGSLTIHCMLQNSSYLLKCSKRKKHRHEQPCVLGISQDESNHLLNLQHITNDISNTYVQRGLGKNGNKIKMFHLSSFWLFL